MLRERQDLQRAHANDKKLLTQDANLNQNELKTTFQREKQQLRDTHKANSLAQKNHTENQLDNMKNSHKFSTDKMKSNFEYLTQKITDKGNHEVQKLQDQNRRDLAAREADFAESRNFLERKVNKASNTGESNHTELMLRKNKESYDNQLKNYDFRLKKMNFAHQRDKSRGIEQQQEARDLMKVKHRRELDKKDGEIRNIREYDIGHLKKKHQDQIEMIQKSKELVDLSSKEKSVTEDVRLNMRLKNQREDLIRQMNKSNEKQQDEIREMAKSFSEEQSEFITAARRKHHEDKTELKHKITLSNDVQKASLEDKISQLEKENKRLEEQFQDKLGVQFKKAAKEIQMREVAERERRAETMRANKRALAQKDRESYLQITRLKGDFEKRLSEQQNHQEIQLTHLTRKYEDMLEQQRLESRQKLELKIAMEKNNYKKLKEANTIEKRSLENQFKLKVDKLKNTNQKLQIVQSLRNDALEERKKTLKET